MLSSIIAWIAALFFLFMAGAFLWITFTTKGEDDGWYVAGTLLAVVSLLIAWGAASLGGI